MTVRGKGTRKAVEASMAKEFLKSDQKSITNGEEVEEDDSSSDSKKCDRDIADWID